jgi:hypothetical protein
MQSCSQDRVCALTATVAAVLSLLFFLDPSCVSSRSAQIFYYFTHTCNNCKMYKSGSNGVAGRAEGALTGPEMAPQLWKLQTRRAERRNTKETDLRKAGSRETPRAALSNPILQGAYALNDEDGT